jgi:hypothetical protein
MLAVFLLGCDQHDQSTEAALDALLSPGRVDRVDLIDRHRGITNAVSGVQMKRFVALLSATNRVERRLDHKARYATIVFIGNGTIDAHGVPEQVAYFYDQRVFSYGDYHFSLRNAENLPQFFQVTSAREK